MENVLAGKRIVVGVTGSIAAFKVAGWVSSLSKEEAQVAVVMTECAQRFISPLTFAALTGEQPYTSMFEGGGERAMSHIQLGQEADIMLIAPATAQTIARLANGMADDLLSTAVLATRAPVLVCPAMNPKMYLHQATQDNIKKLWQLGYVVIQPDTGVMACKEDGPGRLSEWDNVQEVLIRHLTPNDLSGERVLVTAGPTREPIDPARFISNRSSGKMGFALARAAYRRGADVTLVSGPTTLATPYGVKRIDVTTAEEMHEVVKREFPGSSILVKSAAVSDFRPAVSHTRKVKKEDAQNSLELVRNPDILLEIGKAGRSERQLVVGFAAESHNHEEEGRRKLEKKHLDLIAVNDIGAADSGFEAETNRMTLLDSRGGRRELPLSGKLQTANQIFDHLLATFRLQDREEGSPAS